MNRRVRLASLAIVLAVSALATAQALAATADDPLAGLSNKIGALLDIDTASPRIMIVEEDHGVSDSSILSVGDEYRDGWRLAGVTDQAFTLQKGDETRQITVNTNARAQPQQARAAAPSLTLDGGAALAQALSAGGDFGANAGTPAAPGRGGGGRGGGAGGGGNLAAAGGRGRGGGQQGGGPQGGGRGGFGGGGAGPAANTVVRAIPGGGGNAAFAANRRNGQGGGANQAAAPGQVITQNPNGSARIVRPGGQQPAQ